MPQMDQTVFLNLTFYFFNSINLFILFGFFLNKTTLNYSFNMVYKNIYIFLSKKYNFLIVLFFVTLTK
jgi:hypothetical protein